MYECGTIGFRRCAVQEGSADGFAEGLTPFESLKQEKVFARDAFVVDRIVMTMNGKVDLLLNRPARASVANEMNTDGITGLRAGWLRAFAHGEQSIVDGIGRGQKTQIGLQCDVGLGVEAGDLVSGKRLVTLIIEGFDVRPLESGHGNCGISVGLHELRALLSQSTSEEPRLRKVKERDG